ncbi:MAG TPA: 1-phosphofructokinase family hexose kinase [Longimicrobiales bacterium]
MIITLTPNPAINQIVFVDRLALGEKNRFPESQLDPAGKGVNAARVIHRLDWPTIAFGFAAGVVGEMIEGALQAEGVEHHFIRVPGESRINVTLVEREEGRTTDLNGPGPAVDQAHAAKLEHLVSSWLRAARVLVLGGSLPPGVSEDTYAGYISMARAEGVRTILDAEGEPLRLGIAARPDLVKPNVAEAEALLGRALPDVHAIVEGAHEIAAFGIGTVVISMGPEGAVCVDDGRAWRAFSPGGRPLERAYGSGDSMIAGLAVGLARGEGIVHALRLGTAAGAATAIVPGVTLGTAESVHSLLSRVEIEEVAG